MIRALLLAVLVCSSAPTFAALGDDEIRARTRKVLADPDYQSGRPDGGASPKPRPERQYRSRDYDFEPSSAPVQAPAQISMVLVWIVLGGIVVFIAVMLATQARRTMTRGRIAGGKVITAPVAHTELDAAKLDETLRAAMKLASEGRFEEAVHLLLTGAIRELQQNSGLATEAALTSRELLARANLRSDPQSAFRELVFAVEVSLFGGLTVTQDDFERCASSFRTLRQAVVR